MRRVLDSLAWVFVAGGACGLFWAFREPPEPPPPGAHADSDRPEHVQRCLSCQYALGKIPTLGAMADEAAPVR